MRENNFDSVRLFLAVIVLLDHGYGASGSVALEVLPRIFSSQFAVEGFFVISGFLIFASYERSSSLLDYLSRRVRRIAPAYIGAALVALTIGLCFNTRLFLNWETYQFLAANLSLQNYLHSNLPGVFTKNRYAAVNGPLWTIKLEVLFYILVPLLVAFARWIGSNAALISVTALSILFYEWASRTGHLLWEHQLPGQLSFFCLGGWVHYHERTFLRYGRWLGAGGLLILLFGDHIQWYFVRPPAVAVVILAACLSIPKIRLPRWAGDASYGTYVYHWPILQVFVALGLFASWPWRTMLLSAICVAVLATLSWHYLEKPWLGRARNEAGPMPRT